MRQGTTPTHTFDTNVNTALFKSVRITYAQHGAPVLTKETGDCTLEGNSISVVLTQEDTLKFNANTPAQIQIHVLTLEGKAIATDEISIPVKRLLSGEVLK